MQSVGIFDGDRASVEVGLGCVGVSQIGGGQVDLKGAHAAVPNQMRARARTCIGNLYRAAAAEPSTVNCQADSTGLCSPYVSLDRSK